MIIPNINDCPEELCPRDWNEDFTLENGFYGNNCCKCNKSFFGHKRRVMCKECFVSPASHIQAAFSTGLSAVMGLASLLEDHPAPELQERGKRLRKTMNTAAVSFAFTALPRLLDVMAITAARHKRIEQRLRVLRINQLTLGLTYNQRKELRSLSAL